MTDNMDGNALEKAIAEAELAMKGLAVAKDARERKRLTEVLKQRLSDAEQLKKAGARQQGQAVVSEDIKSVPAITIRPQLTEPLSTRSLDRAEQILLLRAGFLNGDKFPPWTKEPVAEDFELKHGEALHYDNSPFSLSSYQRKVLAGWERPDVALARVPPRDEAESAATMDHFGGIDLVQDASTDCSVVASLCAGVARALRGHSRLLRPVLFPQDTQLGVPMLSGNGKYIVRLNFNGCYRRVVIDDRLPASKTDRIIHVIDRLNPRLLWPALVEKAYLKIRGGYDFPGSNSATDLWIITGWLPEQVFLQSDDLDLGSLWTKMCDAFAYGDVLITMGTGKMSRKLEKEVGLAGEHDYAVIDIKEVRGQRLMLVKNPWCEGTNWYRVPRRQSRIEQDILNEEALLNSSPRDLLNADEQLSPGTFWMDIDNAAQYFESIYLNWNPGLFKHRRDLHFSWNLSQEKIDPAQRLHASLQKSPQLAISSVSGGTIWLLLCRHFRNVKEGDASAGLDITGFIALSAHAADGTRIKIAGRAFAKSNYVDSPQILLKLQDTKPKTSYTITPLEQELTSANHTFTLCAFSMSPLSIGHALPAYPHNAKCASNWTNETAGGNVHSPAYSTNPQFKLVLTKPTRLSVLLESADQTLNVHVKLVHGKGERTHQVRGQDIIFDSSDYRRRCCVAESKGVVDAGSYTMICSTFEPDQYGQFELLVESDEPVRLSVLPREGSDRLEVTSKVTFEPQVTRVVAKLTPTRLAKFYTFAKRTTAHASSVPLRISIEQGYGAQRRLLLSPIASAASTDDPVRLPDFDVSPEMQRYGDLYLVLERVCIPDQAGELHVSVTCFVDQLDAVTIGPWRAVDE